MLRALTLEGRMEDPAAMLRRGRSRWWVAALVGLGLLALSNPALAYYISGKVRNLGGVTIKVKTLDGTVVKTTTTASDGKFTLTGISAGDYKVKAIKSGCSFDPVLVYVTLGPSHSGIRFGSPCQLSFPEGDTAYADDYIENYPYGVVYDDSTHRWQNYTRLWNRLEDGGPVTCWDSPKECLNVGYKVYYNPGAECYELVRSFNSVSYQHYRPDVGTAKAIWTDGLTGADNGGYGWCKKPTCGAVACSSTESPDSSCGYHEIVDKLVVPHILGATNSDTCSSSITWWRDLWGLQARKVYPGEITPDYWGLVPTTDDTLEWQTIVRLGRKLYKSSDKVAQRNGYIETIIATHVPVTDNVYGGDEGPRCDGSGPCVKLSSRALAQKQSDGTWLIMISGYSTTWDGMIANTIDMAIDLLVLSDGYSGGHNVTTGAVADWVNKKGLSNSEYRFEGHSLGAADALVLHNEGFGSGATLYALPWMVPNEALGGRTAGLKVYGSDNDTITNSPFGGVNASRKALLGSKFEVVKTGNGFWSLSNPHARRKYQNAVGGKRW